METLEERMAKVCPASFTVCGKGGLIVRKNIQMTSNLVREVGSGTLVRVERVQRLPGDAKKLRGKLVAPVAGWVTVTKANLAHVADEAGPADDREAWEFDARDGYDHYLTRSERCA